MATENYPTYPDLANKVAVVTGGSRGIGAATCRLLAQTARRWRWAVGMRPLSTPWSKRSEIAEESYRGRSRPHRLRRRRAHATAGGRGTRPG